MKLFEYVSLMLLVLLAVAGTAFADWDGQNEKVVVAPYGYANPTAVQPYPQPQPVYPQMQPTYPQGQPCPQIQPMYPQGQQFPQMQPMYPQTRPCSPYPTQQNPASMEYCTRWVAGHWVQVRVMVPGRWEYRPVWVPGYPTARHQWVQGFWQTTASNVRPDLYVWSSQNGLWGVPYQTYQNAGGGYFTPEGVWVPNRR